MEGEIAEAMEGGAVEAVGDAIGEVKEERRRLEREARNKAARSLCCKEWPRRLSSWETTSWRTWTRKKISRRFSLTV